MAAAVNVSKSSRIDKVKPLLSVTLPLLTLRVFGDGENQHDKRRSQKRVRAERGKKPLLKKNTHTSCGPVSGSSSVVADRSSQPENNWLPASQCEELGKC